MSIISQVNPQVESFNFQFYCLPTKQCFNCGKVVEKVHACSHCRFAIYCGEECNKTGWPLHKKVCKAWKPIGDLTKTLASPQTKFPSHLMPQKTTPLLSEVFNLSCKKEQWALDMGCGFGQSTIHLLQLGWSVVALDASNEDLSIFKNQVFKTNKEWLQKGRLIAVNQKAEHYDFPKKFSLVVVADVFPYLKPNDIRSLWEKIYNSLEDNGHLIGSFFIKGGHAEQSWKEWGAWMLEKEKDIEQILGADPGYKIIKCRRRPKKPIPSSIIEFLLQKQAALKDSVLSEVEKKA